MLQNTLHVFAARFTVALDKIGSLTTTKVTATKTSFEKWIRAASNLITFNPSRSIRQMLADYSGVQVQRTVL